MRRLAPALALALALASCTPSGGADLQQAVEAMIEVKVEMRMALDELRQAQHDLAGAREEIDRARGDLDRARRALDNARTTLCGDGADDGALSPRPSVDRSLSPELAAGIRCEAEDTCTIKRSVLDAILDEPASVARQARIIPSVRDGQPQGFKIYGVRAGSLPKLLGLKNGDLLQSLNGTPLDNLDQAMTAYASAREANKLEIAGDRRGQPFRLTITIIDG